MLNLSASKEIHKLLYGDSAIPRYLHEQAGSDRFPGMHRDDCTPTVRVTQQMMTASNAYDLESGFR